MFKEWDLKVFIMGFLHALVAFTAIAVVTQILGLNLSMSFLFAGIGTLIFHLVTKNKLPSVLGVSGLYIGSVIFATQTYGLAYAFGGVIVAGLVYIVIGLLMLKYQDSIMKIFPSWLLSTVIMMIALSLLPIGASLMDTNMIIGIIAIISVAMFDLLTKDKFKPLAMPLGIILATVISYLFLGFTAPIGVESVGFSLDSWIVPQFNLGASLTIGLIAFICMFEVMGDIKNVGSIIKKDVFKEVGVGRICIGNGLATLLGGLGNSSAYTTYSENNGFLLQTKYYNPNAQIVTSLLFIVFAFLTPLHSLISLIPMEVFGGVLVYLFSLIFVNALRNILNSEIDLNKDDKVFTIISVMIAISVLTFVIGGISVSSTAISALVGVLLNLIFNRKG